MKLLLSVCFLALAAAILPLMSMWPGAVCGGAILLVLVVVLGSLNSNWQRRAAALLLAQADGVDAYGERFREKRRDYRAEFGVGE